MALSLIKGIQRQCGNFLMYPKIFKNRYLSISWSEAREWEWEGKSRKRVDVGGGGECSYKTLLNLWVFKALKKVSNNSTQALYEVSLIS